MSKNSAFILALLVCRAAELRAKEDYASYAPPSRTYTCDAPSGWKIFEEEEPTGFVAHMLAPAGPASVFRDGIDIHWAESGRPGFVEVKDAVETLRRGDKHSKRSAGVLKRVNSGTGPARYLEIEETLRLPTDQVPAKREQQRQSVAIIQSGQSYFVLRLSSSEDAFLDNRDRFLRLLKSFRITGY